MHLEVDQKYYLRQKEVDGLVPPVLDSLDNYKILSERMNVLTIYLPWRKFGNVLTSAEPESAVQCTKAAKRQTQKKLENENEKYAYEGIYMHICEFKKFLCCG